eukprot:1831713-Rhodomonas_salina.8
MTQVVLPLVPATTSAVLRASMCGTESEQAGSRRGSRGARARTSTTASTPASTCSRPPRKHLKRLKHLTHLPSEIKAWAAHTQLQLLPHTSSLHHEWCEVLRLISPTNARPVFFFHEWEGLCAPALSDARSCKTAPILRAGACVWGQVRERDPELAAVLAG